MPAKNTPKPATPNLLHKTGGKVALIVDGQVDLDIVKGYEAMARPDVLEAARKHRQREVDNLSEMFLADFNKS